jgi:transposase
VRLQRTESALVRSLERDSFLLDRVERLMTIPAVGPITALTWALEVGDVQRFSSIKKATPVVRGRERFRQHGSTRAAVQTAQQTFTDHADRSGKNDAAKQPSAGHARDKE